MSPDNPEVSLAISILEREERAVVDLLSRCGAGCLAARQTGHGFLLRIGEHRAREVSAYYCHSGGRFCQKFATSAGSEARWNSDIGRRGGTGTTTRENGGVPFRRASNQSECCTNTPKPTNIQASMIAAVRRRNKSGTLRETLGGPPATINGADLLQRDALRVREPRNGATSRAAQSQYNPLVAYGATDQYLINRAHALSSGQNLHRISLGGRAEGGK